MDNGYLNIPFIMEDIINDIKKIKTILVSKSVNAEDLYEIIFNNAELFKLIVEEIIKKTSLDSVSVVYSEIYDILIPYIRDTLAMDNLTITQSEIDDNHMILLNIYIDDIHYGVLNVLDRTYKMPNIDRMAEIEDEAQDLTNKINDLDNELMSAAIKIKYPKKAIKQDKKFRAAYILNKKKAIQQQRDIFFVKDIEKTNRENELAALNAEYEEYQNALENRYYDDKLNERLKDRLNIDVDTNFIISETENIIEEY